MYNKTCYKSENLIFTLYFSIIDIIDVLINIIK